MTLPAGSHPAPLDVVHADLGPEALLRHLALDHDHPVHRERGAAYVQHTHRELHEMTRDATDPAGLLDRLEKARQAATAGVWKLWGMSVMADQDGTSNVDTAVLVASTNYHDEHDKPRTFDATLICEMHAALPELLRLARRGQALEEAVVSLAAQYRALADGSCNTYKADAYDEAALDFAALGATGEAK